MTVTTHTQSQPKLTAVRRKGRWSGGKTRQGSRARSIKDGR